MSNSLKLYSFTIGSFVNVMLAFLKKKKTFLQEVMKLPKVLDRIRSIYRLTARKHKMDAERTVIKQKMNASINGSFFVQATPRKSRPVPRYVYVCIHTVLCVSEIYSWHMFVVVIDILFVFQVRTRLGSQKGQAKRYCGPSQGHSNGGKHTLHCVVNRQAFKS